MRAPRDLAELMALADKDLDLPQKSHPLPPDRIWKRYAEVDRGYETPCWIWQGSLVQGGYGQMTVFGHTLRVHRIAFVLAGGVVLDGYEIDHLCRQRDCIKPSHMEAVTHRENGLRGISPQAVNARKTHCIHGHEFTPANTYVDPSRGGRTCRACHRIRVRDAKRARRLAA